MTEAVGPALAIYAELPLAATEVYSYSLTSAELGDTSPDASSHVAFGAGLEVDLHRYPTGGFVISLGARTLLTRWDQPEPIGAGELHLAVVPEWQSAAPPEPGAGPRLMAHCGLGVGASLVSLAGGHLVATSGGAEVTFGTGLWMSARTRVGFDADFFGGNEGTSTEGTLDDTTAWRMGWTPTRGTLTARVVWVARPPR